VTLGSSPPTNIYKETWPIQKKNIGLQKIKLHKEAGKLTVVLLESPSDWKPWAEAPFDPYPPKK